MSIPTAKCIRHSARVLRKFRSKATCHRSVAGKGARWVSSPRSRVGVLTQNPRSGCPHPRAERVSSLCCRESVLTQEPRGCPHSWTFWVSSPESACRQLTYLVSLAKITAARAEVAVVLHQPLRDPGMTFQDVVPVNRVGLSHAVGCHQHLNDGIPRVIIELAGWPLDL